MSEEFVSRKSLSTRNGDGAHLEIVSWCQANIYEIIQEFFPEFYNDIVEGSLNVELEHWLYEPGSVKQDGRWVEIKKKKGCVDLRCTFDIVDGNYEVRHSLNIEVKSSAGGIEKFDFGDLVRQVKDYKDFLFKKYPDEVIHMLACTPYIKFKKQYEGQHETIEDSDEDREIESKRMMYLVYDEDKYSNRSPLKFKEQDRQHSSNSQRISLFDSIDVLEQYFNS